MSTHPASRRTWRSERGQSLVETALALPLLLIVSVGIFEFGRAYQTWQVVTNAAREGARMSILPNAASADVQDRVRQYLTDGALPSAANATITVNPAASMTLGSGATVNSSVVTVGYPFQFMMLNPIIRLVVSGSTVGGAFTMTATAQMRNESAN